MSCQQEKDLRKLRFPLQSIESSEFNEVVQNDHQKICMTDNGYNQVLVIIDHFTKYAEAVHCIIASAEEACDHLINTRTARHVCPMTFQSHKGKNTVGELTIVSYQTFSKLSAPDVTNNDRIIAIDNSVTALRNSLIR